MVSFDMIHRYLTCEQGSDGGLESVRWALSTLWAFAKFTDQFFLLCMFSRFLAFCMQALATR
jgi:hypothetical protein